MKCPECGASWPRKQGMVCRCGYRFVFDPKRGALTDGRFARAVAIASGEGQRWFTPQQLYAALWLRRATRRAKVAGLAGGGATGLLLGLLAGGFGFLLALPGAAIGYALLRSGRFQVIPSYQRFLQQLARWQQRGSRRSMDKLIAAPSLDRPPADWPEPDVFDYGVARIIVTQHDLLVDWLVRNEVHVEQRALVLSEAGYPRHLLPQARRQLEERPDTPVFLLHDGGHAASRMLSSLNRAGLPIAGHRVVDLGLAREDVRRFPILRFAPTMAVAMVPFLALNLALGQAIAANAAFAALPRETGKSDGSDGDSGSDFG